MDTTTTQTDKFWWTFQEYDDAFLVSAPDRQSVHVQLVDGKYFTIRTALLAEDGILHLDSNSQGRVQLYRFSALVEKIVDYSLLSIARYKHRNAERWAKAKAVRVISRDVKAQWERLLSQTDPNVRSVQRAIFAATFSITPVIGHDGLYNNPYLVKDIRTYPAAAKFLVAAGEYGHKIKFRSWARSDAAQMLDHALDALGLAGNDKGSIKERTYEAKMREYAFESLSADEIVALAVDWRKHLSDTGRTYKNLNLTLDNLPGGIPSRLLYALSLTHLQRPITDRLELLVLLAYMNNDHNDHVNESVFMFAKRDQILETMRRVARFTHNAWKHTRSCDVVDLVQFLADYPERHIGNLVGLADKSIRWHRDEQERIMQAKVDKYGADKQVSAPPIALPTDEGIKFLATVGDIGNEGKTMSHCVASYIDYTVKGFCYLFHVDHKGEMATVEVGAEVRDVVQSQGPNNSQNQASEYGRQILSIWAKQLPEYTPSMLYNEVEFPF